MPAENQASRLYIQDGEYEPDIELILAGIADDIVAEDRRLALQTSAHGKAAFMRQMEANLSVGNGTIRAECLAVRGEHLALVRQLFDNEIAPGFENEQILVVEFNEAWQLARLISFDPEALDAAYAELDDRHAIREATQ